VTPYGTIEAIMDVGGSEQLCSQFLQENRVKHFFMQPLNNYVVSSLLTFGCVLSCSSFNDDVLVVII